MYERICYEHGNVKTGKKLLEIHKTCDCVRCKNKFGRRRVNAVTATMAADDMEAIKRAYAFLKHGSVKTRKRTFPQNMQAFKNQRKLR